MEIFERKLLIAKLEIRLVDTIGGVPRIAQTNADKEIYFPKQSSIEQPL